MRAHRIIALLCAGILALSPAGGHLAYASETQEAQETSAAPGTEVTELEEDGEDPAEGVSIPKETEDASTTAVTDDGGSDQEESQDQNEPQEAGEGSSDEEETTTGSTSSPADEEPGGNEGAGTGETGDEEIENEEPTQKDPQWSLLPLEEKRAVLMLSDLSLSDLKNVKVSYIVDHLQDPEGNYYNFNDTDQFVWSYYRDEYGETIRDEYHQVSREDTVDMTVFERNSGGYKMELIVGDGTQLGNNVRYIVSVFLVDSFMELNQIELYTQDAQGNRHEVSKERGRNIGTTTEYYVPGHQEGTEYYLGIMSEAVNLPDFNVEVYTEEEYRKREADGWQSATPITDIILNPKMWMQDQGYRTTLDVDEQKTFFLVAENPYTHAAYLVRKHAISVKGSSVHVDSSVWTREDGNLVRASEMVNPPIDWSLYPINVHTDHEAIEDHELMLLDGKENNDEYYIVLTAHHDGYEDDAVNHVIFSCTGTYDTLADARQNGAEDLTDKLFADPTDNAFSGYRVERDDLFTDKPFSVFYDDGTVRRIIITVLVDYSYPYQKVWQEYYSQPVVGEQDPWFRVTGVKKGDRELDAYVVENGKSMMLDTYYGMGYQTLFVNEYLSEEDLKALKPIFWVADSAKIRIRTNANQGAEEVSGVTEHDFTSPKEYYALFAGRQKNYIVEVVPKKHGPKLYVFGPDGTEYERNREIFLDDYYQYRHDILIANVGDQKLEGLSVRLENASHVKIDDYWTVGGEGNNTLEPFTSTEKTERYGELQNLAKVRVVSDGAGEITGDLIISADGQESVVIHLSGSAIQPVIRTQELTYAVKYVPYSYIISTSNMNEKVGVTYELWGKLPSGMYFDTKTGELYGVPTETGTYSFTVKANYSDPGFEPSTQKLELEVKDNEDETVFNATDEGYEIVPEENGVNGYVGEQVSDYSFELDLENAEETFITSGDFAEFEKLWINGVELKAGTDFVAEPGSTIAHLFLDIIRKKPVLREGRNTISAQYKINESGGNSAGSSSGSSSSGRVYDSWRSNGGGGGGSTTRRAAQNFWIGVNPSTGPTVNKYFKISKTSANLHKGKTLTLKISRNYTTSVAWATTNPKVARVTGSGKVTAVGKGNCTIVAKSGDGRTQKCKIHVMIPVRTIKLNKTSMKLGAGKYETLKTTVSPSNVDKRDFTWTSSNKKIAEVNASGRVKGISKGTCTITVKAPNGKKSTCKVTVYNIIPVKSVKLNATAKTLNKGASFTLKATIAPSNASNKTLKWYSSNTKVAKVTSAGKVTAVGAGKARIKVKSNNGKTASCLVTVKLVPVSSIALKLDRLLLKKDYKTKLAAVILPSNASDKTVTWTSSDESVVTVAKGEVTGIEEGTAVITAASSNGLTASCEVTVVGPDVEIPQIVLNKNMLEIETGKNETLAVTRVIPGGTDGESNGDTAGETAGESAGESDETILWESTRPDIAEVKDGVVTAKKAGYTTIIARTHYNTVATCSVRVKQPPVEVTAITLNLRSVILNPDYNDMKTAVLTVRFTPSNATDRSITWESADESIAIVKGGVVSARQAGNTTITATTTNGKTAVCQVTVETGPRRIRSLQDLLNVNKDLEADYILERDITLMLQEWEPIGAGTDGFCGTFDGNGHKIIDMNFTKGYECGLFSRCRGTIKNLTVEGYVRAKATGDKLYAGGICGRLIGGTIENCTSHVNVWSFSENRDGIDKHIGGIAGYVSEGTIKNCDFDEYVAVGADGPTINAGGIAGCIMYDSSIINCSCSGAISATVFPDDSEPIVRVDCGGIAGESASNVQISGCTSSGEVSASSNKDNPTSPASLVAAGGIVGVQRDTVISGCSGSSNLSVNGPDSLIFRYTGTEAAVNAVTSIELDVTSKTLHVGDSFTLHHTVHPSNATFTGVIVGCDGIVASYSNGVVRAVGVGETSIVVFSRLYGWVMEFCDVTVLPDDPNEIYQIDLEVPEGDTVGVSQQLQCSATIKPSTASGQTLTWASTDSSIASVDQNGLITTHKAGEVTITAEAPNGVQGELFLDVLPAYFDIIGEHEYAVTRGEKISIPIRLYIDGSISPGEDKYKIGMGLVNPEVDIGIVDLAWFDIDSDPLFNRFYGDKVTVSSYTINGNIIDATFEIDTARMAKTDGTTLIIDLADIGTVDYRDVYKEELAIIRIE